MTSDSKVWFYIERGAIDRYLGLLADDFVGYIKYGHSDFGNYPLLLGEYTKSDLYTEDIGDGRKALFVKPKFYDTYLLKDIQAMPFDVGVSVEMTVDLDSEATEQLGFEVVKDLFIKGFAVVGEAGNVNSSEVRLSGGEEMELTLEAINKALEQQADTDLEAVKEAMKKLEAQEPEEIAEEPAEEEKELDAEPEEVVEEETTIDDVLAKVEELTAKVEELTEENKTLTASIEALEADKTALTEKLSAKEAEEKKFVEKFKNLTVNVSDSKEPEVKEVSFAMDGIGEL